MMTRKEYMRQLEHAETILDTYRQLTREVVHFEYISLVDIESILERELRDDEMEHALDVLHNCYTTNINEFQDILMYHEYFGELI